MTASQLAGKVETSQDSTSKALRTLQDAAVTACLTPDLQNSRVYALTDVGMRARSEMDCPEDVHSYTTDVGFWRLYAWCSHRHRWAILSALDRPMRPSELKRYIRYNKPTVQMSTNNCWDAVRLMTSHGVLRPLEVEHSEYVAYEPTDVGTLVREHLLRAEA